MTSASTLRGYIIGKLRSGQWRAGDRLPTERALSAQFGLGRAGVRKVLQELKARALIRQTVGSGTYVTEQAAAALRALAGEDPVAQTSPAQLMEARLAFEPAIIEMVIGHATASDFARMDECCAQAEQAATLEEFEYWDGLLHEVIADASRNGFVAGVFKLMNQVRAQGAWGQLKRRSVTPERRIQYQLEHRALVQAIKDRDLPQAKALAFEHLLQVRRNLLNY
ncbi:MAG: FadR family transcriptional regulator [Burkholderiales bacterium]|nr:FCD domain-containing protein [Burkholderiales bacterium]MDE1926150.1 FadR family transcriptional regulator [Burkholderiales bacterium]MDE2160504.1 FadR family transcriptional regulator [Burkholderiales bacterium]MDE2502926.1 FadR family transcriptional regulator [Burkholderiales bacterium]